MAAVNGPGVSPFGLRIIENPLLVVPGEPRTVRRSWRERLFSRPWHPWTPTKTIVPMVPDPSAYALGGCYVMHPATARALMRAVG